MEGLGNTELEDVRSVGIAAAGTPTREHTAVGTNGDFDLTAAAEGHRLRIGPTAQVFEAQQFVANVVANGLARRFQALKLIDGGSIREYSRTVLGGGVGRARLQDRPLTPESQMESRVQQQSAIDALGSRLE